MTAPAAPGPPVDGISIVVPTVGRRTLTDLLGALATMSRPDCPVEVIVVDDRPFGRTGRPITAPRDVRVVRSGGRGPAAARNAGWRAARHAWVAFLDDDVRPPTGWLVRLAEDLRVPAGVAGVQGRIDVPLPAHRRPTDWERNTAGLATARWITADMAYRRDVLAAVGGFDERFPRAYREDAELAARVRRAGWALRIGDRRVVHPVRAEGTWISVRVQRGNADDALLRRLYGRRWRRTLEIHPGRRGRHAVITAAALVAGLAAVAPGRPDRRALRGLAGTAAAVWLAGTVEFAVERIRPGPGGAREVGTMLATSVAIPPVATAHWLYGWLRWLPARTRGLPARTGPP